jgi:hypothetical protein
MVNPIKIFNIFETIRSQTFTLKMTKLELMMNFRWVFVGLVLFVTPLHAEALSPWFGSEASPATQISLESDAIVQSESLVPVVQDAKLGSPLPCAIEGCPTPSGLAK